MMTEDEDLFGGEQLPAGEVGLTGKLRDYFDSVEARLRSDFDRPMIWVGTREQLNAMHKAWPEMVKL